ncbi:MAG: cupin domain-containing protein [Niabella sp.]
MIDFFKQIVAPYSVEQFFEQYHEKNILHVQRNDEHYYKDILTSLEISSFLDRQDIFYPSVRIVKNGKEIPNAEYTNKGVPIGHHKKDGVINTEKAFALFNNGATLVIQAGQRYFDNLSKCCMALSQKFNSPVQANLYITPNKSQGFNPHWDTHDVFVVQISGTKTWHLYGFEKELPTKNQPFISKGYEKQPLQTIQVCPGDFLYVPRGYVHDAQADDGISAHITIGVLSFTWARLFNEVFPQMEEHKAFREAVPFWRDDFKDMLTQKIDFLKEILTSLDYDKGIQRLNAQYHKIQPQPLTGYFQSLLDIEKINDDSIIALNEAVLYNLNEKEDAAELQLLGKTISFPQGYVDAIRYILSNKVASVKDFPGLPDSETRKTFAQKLIREGVVCLQHI